MRSPLLAIAVLPSIAILCACFYDDPPTSGAFKCDDTHPCPGGEPCVNGACNGVDPAMGDGVKCGASTCPDGMQCCAGPVTSPVCQPAGTICNANGAGAASCDGIEDCDSGQACCGTTSTTCSSSNCSPQACQTPDDCIGPSDNGNCCFDLSYLPWGFCC